MPTSYEFAVMQLTRFRPVRGVLRTASTDSIVLHEVRRNRWHFKNNRPNLWSEVGWLRRNFYLPWQRSTQSAWKQCGARHARLNRVTRTIAKWFAQSTSGFLQNITPRGFKGPPIGAPPKPNEVGLVGRGGAAERLSFCPERQNEGCGACDDEARLSPLSFVVQRKMGPPEGTGLAPRPVKT